MEGHRSTRRTFAIGGLAAATAVVVDQGVVRALWSASTEAAEASFGARAADAAGRSWWAGDLHVHTPYSHDVLGVADDNTGPEEFFTFGLDVGQRFAESRGRGLDYLAISDHNDLRSATDPGFGTAGVIGIPTYEASLRGHAHMIGAAEMLDPGDRSAAALARMAEQLRAAGGVLQANHPADGVRTDVKPCGSGCGECSGGLDWSYGFEVRPDVIEIWNSAAPPNVLAEFYWECWLNLGERIGATGGSDAHWLATNEISGPGQPTTWVLAAERTRTGVLEAIRAGRTTLCWQPPARGGFRLLLEGDPDRDGAFRAVLGDDVAPGTPMRVRAEGLRQRALLQVRANGARLLERPLDPGQEVRFAAPEDVGWVRAKLLFDANADPRAALCLGGDQALGFNCQARRMVAALTSPIYLRRSCASRAPGGAPGVSVNRPRARGRTLEVTVEVDEPADVVLSVAAGAGAARRTLGTREVRLPAAAPRRLRVTLRGRLPARARLTVEATGCDDARQRTTRVVRLPSA